MNMKLHFVIAVILSVLISGCTSADKVPGVIIDYSPASSEIYLGSPAIVVLPNGNYIAKCEKYQAILK